MNAHSSNIKDGRSSTAHIGPEKYPLHIRQAIQLLLGVLRRKKSPSDWINAKEEAN